MQNNSTKPKVLMILHQESSTPGRMGMRLVDRGFALDIRKPPLGDPLPETLDDHAGAIMFGGPMSANDSEEFIKRETDWIGVPLKEERPFLGICLGAQKLVRHLGGEVKSHPDDLVEVGYYPIEATDAGKALMDWPPYVYQWHREGFDLPSEATLLATGHDYPHQAFRYGKSTFAVQFHAEVTTAMMMRWTVKGAERMLSPGAQTRAEQAAGRLIHDAAVQKWLDDFLDIWIGTAADPVERR